jgi:TATA-box binding protein (TBP) (component of TFIID and TFIIIB)
MSYSKQICNINYKAVINDLKIVEHLSFNKWKPQQYVYRHVDGYTIVIFRNGKCRIMGCKQEPTNLPYNIKIIRIQSITLSTSLLRRVNLYHLSKMMTSKEVMFEPELFPALRILKFKPLCINIFASGKMMILGVKSMDHDDLINNIINFCDSMVKRVEHVAAIG